MYEFVIIIFKCLLKLNQETCSERHDITEKLLKVALDTIKQTNKQTTIAMSGILVEAVSIRKMIIKVLHYVINVISDLIKVGSFLRVVLFPTQIKLTATI
jgi:hypothetical protein